MSDSGFELRPCVSLPMVPTIERASERAVRTGFDVRPAHPSVRPAARSAMIRRMMLTIAHRLLLGVLALLVLAAPAGAAEVARIDDASLRARDDRASEFCLDLRMGDGSSGGGYGTCGPAPWRPRRSMLIAWVSGAKLFAAGAVPASVTRAEAELADGRRVAFDTVVGPGYRGRYAGRLRFFLAELPLVDPEDDDTGGLRAVRFSGADGALLGVASPARLGSPVGREQVVLREAGRRRSITVRAAVLRRHTPTPLALDRFEDQQCLVVRTRAGVGEQGSSTVCRGPGPERPALLVFPEPGCGPLRTVLSGFVGDAVTAVRLKLGSGRVREVPVRTLRGPQGEQHRYVAASVPRGEAVRSVSAVGTDAGYEIGEPPGGLPCVSQGGAFAMSYLTGLDFSGPPRPPAPDDQVAAEAGGHRLLVRDAEGERLCAGVDRMAADGSDCALPVVAAEDSFGMAASGTISAVLPAEVARVRLPGGRAVHTVEGGYRGRYAGHVRFLFAEAPVAQGEQLAMLDSAGAVIGRVPVFSPHALEEKPDAAARLAAGRGWRLRVARYDFGSCLELAVGGGDPSCGSVVGDDEDGAFGVVGCGPRVAVLAGPLSRSTREVRAVLRGGRTVRARVVRIPRRFGRGRAWVLALPRGARVKALSFDGRRATFPLLPARDQCGYRVFAPGLAEPDVVVLPR